MPDRPDRAEDDRGELKELRRELAETHAIGTRTHNAVASLAAQVKELVTLRDRYERGLNLNSFVAYVLFTVLLGGGFYLLYRSRADRLVSDRDAAVARRDQAIADQRKDRDVIDRREDAARKAGDFLQLIRDGKRVEVIKRYGDVKALALSEVERNVFEAEVERARAELVADGYAQGLAAFRGQQWKRAAGALEGALAYAVEGPDQARMRYHYGVALHRQGNYAEAANQLEQAIAGGAERTDGGDARFFLAAAFEMLRQLERARTEYQKFADGHPMHPMRMSALRKVRELGGKLRVD